MRRIIRNICTARRMFLTQFPVYIATFDEKDVEMNKSGRVACNATMHNRLVPFVVLFEISSSDSLRRLHDPKLTKYNAFVSF